VATISEILPDSTVKVHFDNWSESFDYVCRIDDDDLHPVGFCQSVGHKLEAPRGYAGDFKWPKYLKEIGAVPVWSRRVCVCVCVCVCVWVCVCVCVCVCVVSVSVSVSVVCYCVPVLVKALPELGTGRRHSSLLCPSSGHPLSSQMPCRFPRSCCKAPATRS
jgi:hypothetical protein